MSVSYEFKVPMRNPINRKRSLFPKGTVLDIVDVETLAEFYDEFDMGRICLPTLKAPTTGMPQLQHQLQ